MIGLARSVGKLIATVWLDDSPVLDTLFTEVVDFGASGFERAVETRKTERFFEDCADQVLSRCTSFFDGEFRKIEERRRSTILEEISRVCSEYVTTKKLIEEKFSGDQLAEELLSKLTLVDMKDQTEKWFVETVLKKVCFYVCEYKHLAPDFQLLSTRHILDNTDQILEILSVVVERVSPNQGNQTEIHSKYLRYKSRLRKRVQNIEIFGLSTQSVKS